MRHKAFLCLETCLEAIFIHSLCLSVLDEPTVSFTATAGGCFQQESSDYTTATYMAGTKWQKKLMELYVEFVETKTERKEEY